MSPRTHIGSRRLRREYFDRSEWSGQLHPDPGRVFPGPGGASRRIGASLRAVIGSPACTAAWTMNDLD